MHGALRQVGHGAFQTNHTLFFRYLCDRVKTIPPRGTQDTLTAIPGVAKLVSNNNGRISVGGKLKNNFNFSAKTSQNCHTTILKESTNNEGWPKKRSPVVKVVKF